MTIERIGGNAQRQLKALVHRIEALEEEKSDISALIRDVFSEAKGNGYDIKALKAILKERKMREDIRKEHNAMVEIYRTAVGYGHLDTEENEG